MKTATNQATGCTRCKGEGMGQHSRANGACYKCGRLPADAAVVVTEEIRSTRAERARLDLRAYFASARRAVDEGDLENWLSEPWDAYGPTCNLSFIRGCTRACLPDVAAKARTAFAGIGVAV